jgi:hypothetical protein
MPQDIPSRNRYPDPKRLDNKALETAYRTELRSYLIQLVRELEDRDRFSPLIPINKDQYIVTSPVINRAFDPTTATLQQTKEVLSTLLNDLLNSGIINARTN